METVSNMTEERMESLRFPVGRLDIPDAITKDHIDSWIEEIRQFPTQLRTEVEGLGESELNQRYRPEGWMIRQVVHHCADSHINSISRFKLAMTEDYPTIRPYFEDRWAELPDTLEAPIELSLNLLDALHTRWVFMLERLTDDQYSLKFKHPEYDTTFRIDETICNYAWHCRHHLAHVVSAKQNPF